MKDNNNTIIERIFGFSRSDEIPKYIGGSDSPNNNQGCDHYQGSEYYLGIHEHHRIGLDAVFALRPFQPSQLDGCGDTNAWCNEDLG